MILTVTPNIAIDRTYVVGEIEVGAVHKVSRVVSQVGGKGVNVARTIGCLGHMARVTGLFGTSGVQAAEQELRADGFEADLYPVAGPPRVTVTVTAEGGLTTAFDEPGPTVSGAEWLGFENHIAGLLDPAQWVVVAGSLPPGAPDNGLEQLVTRIQAAGAKAILDARGVALRAALPNKPLVIKLNRGELSQTVGRPCTSDADVVRGIRGLQQLGAQMVIVTLGTDGAIGVDDTDLWRVKHPAASGNPIGAGDAFTAGVAIALDEQRPFADALRDGAAAALASLSSPRAGAVETTDVEAARERVAVTAITEEGEGL